MSAATGPVAVVLATREGQPTLGGFRRFAGDFDEAQSIAAEIDGTVLAVEEVIVDAPFPPVRVETVRMPLPVFTETLR